MPLTVAVEISAAEAPPVLAAVLLDACSAGLRRAQCVAAGQGAEAAAAVAIVTWADAAHARIEVGVERAERAEWRSRELSFSDADPVPERWKAAGFSIAILVGEQPLPGADLPVIPALPPEPAALVPYLDLKALAGVGLVGSAWRLGGELRFSLAVSGLPWFASVAGHYALAQDAQAEIDVRWLDLALGGGVRLELLPGVEARGRLELLLENIAASAERQGVTDRRAAWVPGLRVGADAVWPSRGQWAVVGSVDAFWLDGSTAVNFGQARTESAGAGVAFSVGLECRL